jgi:hypothetical protein
MAARRFGKRRRKNVNACIAVTSDAESTQLSALPQSA